MSKNDGVLTDPLFVGPTRPTTIAGVTWPAVLLNVVLTMEFFIWTHNLLWLLLFMPVHAIFYLICLRDPRTFELLALWGQTKGPALLGNLKLWGAATYSPLPLFVGKQASGASKRKFRELSK